MIYIAVSYFTIFEVNQNLSRAVANGNYYSKRWIPITEKESYQLYFYIICVKKFIEFCREIFKIQVNRLID